MYIVCVLQTTWFYQAHPWEYVLMNQELLLLLLLLVVVVVVVVVIVVLVL